MVREAGRTVGCNREIVRGAADRAAELHERDRLAAAIVDRERHRHRVTEREQLTRRIRLDHDPGDGERRRRRTSAEHVE